MSIRTKILLPLLTIILVAAFVAGSIGFMGLSEHARLALRSEKAIAASDASRGARDNFDRAEQLAGQVLAMTDFMEPAEVQGRFQQLAAAAQGDLARLKASALSPGMEALVQRAIDAFGRWTSDAEILLGLKPARAIATSELMARHSRQLRAVLDEAVSLSGQDAKAEIQAAGDLLRNRFAIVFAIAGALAVAAAAGAVWLAGNLARPLVELVGNAEALAGGEVSVKLVALDRKDEVGGIARAIQIFRGNIQAQRASEDSAAEARRSAETVRAGGDLAREASAREQAVVVGAIASGLAHLSRGDLTFRLSETFPGEYEMLRRDFNGAMDTLAQTMASIARATDCIRSGTGQVSHSADELSRRTEQQAASLEETAAALDEITATVRRTAEGANHARDVVDTAKADAARSGEVVSGAVQAMAEIDRSAKQIASIIGVIDEIAFQTNLLALNAGVEAARAGDSGRGFAVVAQEVRALAQRSADAAKEIKALIRASTVQVGSGVELVGQAGQALARIAAQVADINAVVTEIASSAKDQATGLAEVNTAINQMDQMTQRNAAMVGESTAASRALAREAEDLEKLVSHFDAVGSAGKAPPKRPQAGGVATAMKTVGGRGLSAVRKPQHEAVEEGWEEF